MERPFTTVNPIAFDRDIGLQSTTNKKSRLEFEAIVNVWDIPIIGWTGEKCEILASPSRLTMKRKIPTDDDQHTLRWWNVWAEIFHRQGFGDEVRCNEVCGSLKRTYLWNGFRRKRTAPIKPHILKRRSQLSTNVRRSQFETSSLAESNWEDALLLPMDTDGH
jgi:hypothetical protein